MVLLFEEYQDLIPDYAAFQEALGETLPLHLRVNTLKADSEETVARLRGQGLTLRPSCRGASELWEVEGTRQPGSLPEYFLGHVHPQALTSCLASGVLNPPPGSLVLDLCAAPGGKTSHMAALMGNTGLIVANELHASRQAALGHTLDRLGVCNTLMTDYQGQEFPSRYRFDYVLADVPCSGEGVFRRLRPDQRHGRSPLMARLPDLQKKIILRAYDVLNTGGEMLYATCTYNPAENEAVVQFLLQERPAVLLPIQVGVPFEPALDQWMGVTYEPQLRRAARFYPHQSRSVGFFLARIGRGE